MPDLKAARKNENFFQRSWHNIRQYIRESIGELRKVSWPTRQEALNLTKIVLVVILFMAFVLGTLDIIFAWFMSLLFKI